MKNNYVNDIKSWKMQSLENNQKTTQNKISLQTTWCCSEKHYSRTGFGSVDFHQLDFVENVQDLCVQSTNIIGYVRKSTLDIKTISVRRTHAVFDSGALETMLCISSLGSSVSGANQTGGLYSKQYSGRIHTSDNNTECFHIGSVFHLYLMFKNIPYNFRALLNYRILSIISYLKTRFNSFIFLRTCVIKHILFELSASFVMRTVHIFLGEVRIDFISGVSDRCSFIFICPYTYTLQLVS